MLVVGAGPAGLLIAAELARRGVHVAILERRPVSGAGSRAIGVHPPTLAALEPSGAADRILAEAIRIPRGVARSRGRVLGEVRFDRSRSRFPFVASAPQSATEAAVAGCGPEPLRGVRAVSLEDVGDRVIVRTATGETSARFVVVATGAAGRELIADAAGISARRYPDRYLMTDIASAPGRPESAAVITIDPAGVLESFPLPRGGRRLVAWDAPDAPAAPGVPEYGELERLRRAVSARTGDEELAASVADASSFGIRRVLLRRMRIGRIMAIGDAAHEVSPIGGQGMNLGLLDAVTLAPILAAQVSGVGSGAESDAAAVRWERDRLASARTAARLAGLNTALGRPRSPRAQRLLAGALGAALATPVERVAARAYTMGFDRGASRVTSPGRR